MCGICGVVSFDSSHPVDETVLKRMSGSIVHRGPDDFGYHITNNIGLASRRLSIIDLPGGRQPISSEDESKWIVYNGEIYNYRELRSFCQKRGHIFSTSTDTEVILHLFEEFGPECLDLLSGIFSFAIWDEKKKELFLARDKMGIKPLYYTVAGSQLVFGSEMKAILAHPTVEKSLDLNALNEYLSYEYVPSPKTIIKNVHRLEPGYFMRFNQGSSHLTRYWNVNLAKSEEYPPADWRDYVDGLYNVMKGAVSEELVSDVPVGVLLSGGVDSTSLAALMTKQYTGTIKSFSVSFDDKSFDESRYSGLAAKALGTDHNDLVLTSKMVSDLMPSIMDHLDEPFGDSSFIPTFFLSRFAREQVKVVLGGDGSDEVFVGYPTFTAHKLIEYYERVVPWKLRGAIVPKLLKMAPVSFNNISMDFKLRRFISGRGVPLIARHHRWLGSFIDEEKKDLLEDWYKPILKDSYNRSYLHEADCTAKMPLNRIIYNDLKMYLENDILFKVDRASMASSLEVRVPFLNRAVVDFTSRLPIELKMRRLTGKYILKKCMKGAIPAEIINRPKKGFNMPVAKWISDDLKEITMDMLSPDRIRRQGLFKSAYVEQLLKDHFEKKVDNRKLIWTMLMFQLWQDKYMNQ